MTAVPSIDPRTGQTADPSVAEETTEARIDEICRAAAAAAPVLAEKGRSFRAGLLRAMADALEADRETIVRLADRETALGDARLNGELTRTAYQLRLFGEVLDEGSYLEVSIDHAGDTPMGPRPDLRRMLLPIGPVAVFGASNFPLAFSVAGGDTASALAAGCPVVIKAHHSHPATSQRVFEAISRAARESGAPEATVGIVYGRHAGATLVQHPVIKAAGFTGSLTGGRALADLCASRPEPIPFFGELSSLNPVVVTKAAAAERAEQIAAGLVGSFTLGAGQFCTKPGLVFVPAGPDGDRLREAMAGAVAEMDSQIALNNGISQSYQAQTQDLAGRPALDKVAESKNGSGTGFPLRATLFATSTEGFGTDLTEECFGPTTLLVAYRDDDDLLDALRVAPGSLTATVHVAEDDSTLSERVLGALRDKAGRLLFNGYPTGVAVSWAQHHGGPWPSTNSQHTSVGTTAIRRFLRPVVYQNAPQALLPVELREENTAGIPRRIDGRLTLPG